MAAAASIVYPMPPASGTPGSARFPRLTNPARFANLVDQPASLPEFPALSQRPFPAALPVFHAIATPTANALGTR